MPAARADHPAVVVTRPAREAAGWLAELEAAGLSASLLPLIAIGPAPDAEALARCRRALAAQAYAAVMFVSANAVRGFLGDVLEVDDSGKAGGADHAGAGMASVVTWPTLTRAWATGPGTRQALIAARVPAAQIDAPPEAPGRFDSEALWSQVATQVPVGAQVLVVRGADGSGEVAGRDWLSQQLVARGARVAQVAAYARAFPAFGPSEQDTLSRALAARAWWLFSSSEAVGNLCQLAPGQDWQAARALCTHARIAAAAREAGFGEVAETVPRPAAVAACLQSRP